MRAELIFKARIFTERFSKLTTPDRNNLISRVLDFLQPQFSFLIPVLQSFIGITDCFVSIGHSKNPTQKAPYVLKDFIRLFTEPINFHIRYHSQTNFPPITGMINITRSTNIRQRLKNLYRLTNPHTVAPSRDNTYFTLFQKYY